LLTQLFQNIQKMVELQDVLEVVSEVSRVSITQIRSKKRYRLFAQARGLFFVFARDYTNCSIMEIATFINRHHATCVHYCKITPDVLKYDKKYRIEYGDIQNRLEQLKFSDEKANANMLQQIEFQIAKLLKKKERISNATKDSLS